MLGIGLDSLMRHDESEVEVLRTEYPALDRIIGGFYPEEFVILGGRPGCGKSTLAMNFAQYTALKFKRAAAIFSMELSTKRLAERNLASLARVDLESLKANRLDDDDLQRVCSAAKQCIQAPLFFDTTPTLTTASLYSKITALREEHDVALAVVDYPHLMRTTDDTRSEAERLAEISRDLKAISKELRMTVLALSPLNRSPLLRVDGRPQISDLRGSGSLEDDADTILLLHRPDRGDARSAEIIVGKQRHGSEGSVKLRFFGEYARFDPCPADCISDARPNAREADEEKSPINEVYINQALGFGFSQDEMQALLAESGLVIKVGKAWEPTGHAKQFLHPKPEKGRIWRRDVIEYLRTSRGL
ncbi:MAG: DnaB-like helicase C-terminal domain-containing protein [Lysobacter sp.]|nr:DnaB-like helicase C-terminal domain-containing protein [Lysobacter sp.]